MNLKKRQRKTNFRELNVIHFHKKKTNNVIKIITNSVCSRTWRIYSQSLISLPYGYSMVHTPSSTIIFTRIPSIMSSPRQRKVIISDDKICYNRYVLKIIRLYTDIKKAVFIFLLKCTCRYSVFVFDLLHPRFYLFYSSSWFLVWFTVFCIRY